jgi:hypothetical protein
MDAAELTWDLRKYKGWYDDDETRAQVLSHRGF